MDSITNWRDSLRMLGQTARELAEGTKGEFWRTFLEELHPVKFPELSWETRLLLFDGLDESNFEEPKHYCWALKTFYGSSAKGGLCDVPFDCGYCEIFQYMLPTVYWLCAICRAQELVYEDGTQLRYENVDGFYSSGECSSCGRFSIVLAPIRPIGRR